MRVELRRFAFGEWSSELPASLDSAETALFAFGAPSLSGHAELASLVSAFPQSKIIGCSTAGEILDAQVHDESLVVAIARFDPRTSLRVASAPIGRAAASRVAGSEIARALAGPGLAGIIVLSEGLHVNGTELAAGLRDVAPHVAVVGGLAADADRFRKTWVLSGAEVSSRRVVALGLYGPHVRITHGSKGGWDMFGIERRVTRSVGNVLYELDGKPALRLYKEYLGERSAGLPATALLFPLAMRESHLSEKQLVRTVLAVDEERQSLTFAGDIPTGSLVQLMRANFDRLVQGASDAATIARPRESHEGDLLALAVTCVGRRLVLGERVEEELEATLSALPSGTRQAGFYSYGELSPFASGPCDLHNQTMTLTTISERA